MADHVINQITFGSEPDAIAGFQQMLADVREKGKPLGSVDFNRLIPMPPELNIEASGAAAQGLKMVREFIQEGEALEQRRPQMDEAAYKRAAGEHRWKGRRLKLSDPVAWTLGEKAYANVQKYGAPTWYEWRLKNWGTKWNAWDGHLLEGRDDILVFQTADGPALEILTELSKRYPCQDVVCRWASERLGYNVGEVVIRNGTVIDENTPYPGSREAYELAEDIHGIDLADHGLVLSKDRVNYECQEPRKPAHKKKKHPQER